MEAQTCHCLLSSGGAWFKWPCEGGRDRPCLSFLNAPWQRGAVDIKQQGEGFAIVADMDDDREPNALVKGHMSIMCIISPLNY